MQVDWHDIWASGARRAVPRKEARLRVEDSERGVMVHGEDGLCATITGGLLMRVRSVSERTT